MPTRAKKPTLVEFDEPYPAVLVDGTGYELQIPAVQRSGLSLVCCVNVWNGEAKLTYDDIRITNSEAVTRFLEDVKKKLRGALSTSAQRAVWLKACQDIARGLRPAIDAQEQQRQAAANAKTHTAAAATPTIRMLDRPPVRIDRPLALIGTDAYVATWLYVEVTTSEVLKGGKLIRLDPPQQVVQPRLVIVRSDGQIFGLDGEQSPLEALGFDVRLREQLRDHHAWSAQGVRDYIGGRRVDAKDVFMRLVASYDCFIDFSRSLASQRAMCRLMACFSLATWFANEFDNVAYFQPTGDLGSGKTKLIEVWVWTSYLGQMVTSGSSFATLRDLADYGASLAVDEAEFLSDPKKVDPHLRELVLGGYRKTGTEIGLKEPLPDGSYVTRWVKTYSPRAFAAIKLPDRVLGSRTIVIPLVKSTDKDKANRMPQHAGNWPTDRDALLRELWSIGVQLQSKARSAWDSAPALQTLLVGRDFEPWRPLLAVALLLEQAGVPGLVADIRGLMKAYQAERSSLTYGSDLSGLIAQALAEMAKSASVWQPPTHGDTTDRVTPETVGEEAEKDVMRIVSADVARHIREHLKDTPEDDAADSDNTGSGWPSPVQIGTVLGRLRIGRRHHSKRERWREMTREELDEVVRAYLPNDTEASSPPTVSGVTEVKVSPLSGGAQSSVDGDEWIKGEQ